MRFDIESRRETDLTIIPLWENPFCCGNPEIVSLAVSPDGTQLATTFIGGDVEVTPADGGQSRDVFRPPVPELLGTGSLRQALAWTPDQRFLLWVRGDGALWKVPALGGEAEKVGISMPGIKSPAVHPDGKQFVFSAPGGSNTSKILALENLLPAADAKK